MVICKHQLFEEPGSHHFWLQTVILSASLFFGENLSWHSIRPWVLPPCAFELFFRKILKNVHILSQIFHTTTPQSPSFGLCTCSVRRPLIQGKKGAVFQPDRLFNTVKKFLAFASQSLNIHFANADLPCYLHLICSWKRGIANFQINKAYILLF